LAVLLPGCGGAEKPGTEQGGSAGGAGPSGGEADGQAGGGKTAKEKVPFPERTLKEIGGALASESTLTEDMMKRYSSYQARSAELRKAHEDDPVAMLGNLKELHKKCGYRDSRHQTDEQTKVLRALGIVGMMSSAEVLLVGAGHGRPAAGAISDAWKRSAQASRKAVADAKLSEADLRLAHKYMQKFADQSEEE
jgi:hypothetical protein